MNVTDYLDAAPSTAHDALRRALDDRDDAVATDAALDALRTVRFPLRKDASIVVASTLNDAQRSVAGVLAFRRGLNIKSFALPHQARVRRRWLGIDPPGVLEETIGPRALREPRWARYLRLERERRDAEIRDDLQDEPVRQIEALIEVALGSYGLHSIQATAPLAMLVDEHAADLLALARRLGPELLALFGARHGDGGPRFGNDFLWYREEVNVAAVLPLIVNAQPFDESIVPLMSYAGVTHARAPDLVGWIPEERRDAIATEIFRRSNVQAVPVGVAILARFTLPALAAHVIERFGGGKADGQTPPSLRSAWMKQLEDLADQRPEVAPLIAAALTPKKRAALGLKVTKAKRPKKAKWVAPPASASIEERLASAEDATQNDLQVPNHAFCKFLDEVLRDVFGRTWRPLPLRRPASLSALERRALTTYTDAGVGMAPNLSRVGLPDTRQQTRRMLGLDAPIAEDTLVEIDGEILPAWCAMTDALYSGTPTEPVVRAIAALPDRVGETIWRELREVRGSITWRAPLVGAPTKQNPQGTALPGHRERLARFLGALGAALGAPAFAYCEKDLKAQMEDPYPSSTAVLLDMLVLSRAPNWSKAATLDAVALVHEKEPPEMLSMLREMA